MQASLRRQQVLLSWCKCTDCRSTTIIIILECYIIEQSSLQVGPKHSLQALKISLDRWPCRDRDGMARMSGGEHTFRLLVSSLQGLVQSLGVRLRSEKVNGRRTALKPSCFCLNTTVLKSATCDVLAAYKPSTMVCPLLKPNCSHPQ